MEKLKKTILYDLESNPLEKEVINSLKRLTESVKIIFAKGEYLKVLKISDLKEADSLITRLFDYYPDDVRFLWFRPINVDKMKLSWEIKKTGARDNCPVIDEWSKLDEFIEKIIEPENDPDFEKLIIDAKKNISDDRYLMVAWWHFFFEEPWSLRGMENILIDYFIEKENVHRLHATLSKQYSKYIEILKHELCPDGFFTSDDLGHQTQPMMKPEIFDEMIKPYYSEIGTILKKNNLHWWLHSCGNNTPLLPSIIETGVDVFHPVQKGTMDELEVARKFSKNLVFLAGIDVQHTLQEKNENEIRREVRFLIDTFDQPDGGMCIGAGNGIVSGTPIKNIEVFLDEAVKYGFKHRQKFNS